MTSSIDRASINNESVENLIEILSSIFTSNNLLVLTSQLSKLIDYLTPFSRLKECGKFQKSVWLESFDQWKEVVGTYDGLIVVVDDTEVDVLESLVSSVKCKLYIVVKNLSRSSVYKLNKAFKISSSSQLKTIVDVPTGSKSLKLSPSIRLFNWDVNPICITSSVKEASGANAAVAAANNETDVDSDILLSLELPFGGLQSYFNQPIEQISKLSNAFISLLKISPQLNGTGKMFKLKNIYAKGDHSSLMVKILQDEKIPDFLNSQLSSLEQQFYLSKLKGNTDLVILERNLDIASVAFNQLNYQGLIDDLFEISLNTVEVGENKQRYTLNDELYSDLKHLNFASIGLKLNHLARAIQSEYSKKDSIQSIQEIRSLVNNLGPLSNKQELVKKHTELSEIVLNYIKFGNVSSNPVLTNFNVVDEYEKFLEFQNDIFDLDYKQHILKLKEFITKCFSDRVILLSLILISNFNDGIKERDFDQILEELIQNFGIDIKFTIDNLVKFNVIQVVGNSSTTGEIFGALTSISIGNSNTKGGANVNSDENGALDLGYDNLSKLGITGGQLGLKTPFTLIDKFFNLHPQVAEDEEEVDKKDGTLVNEYKDATFGLPSTTVPLLARLVQSLYMRDFLVNKPVNNLSRRPNWDNLGLDNMFHGKSLDINICDTSDEKRKKINGNGNGSGNGNGIDNGSAHGDSNGSITSNAIDYVIVTVIGGITRSEISCLKYIEQRINQDKNKRKKVFIILTSGIVNCTRLLEVCR
ncbi:vacuolar protein sorting-associated protein 33 [[Candida] railenensis]|uniref:Vacuolar protein sorting-associated protein 33 n=1 Tax=[Candida] railenensis TaxID=45579 RepID=A0A9P0VYE3_9ASCO|nr:vacuolar protein sorting-associated protein 33 [[Candida] railenensis]